MNWDLWRRVSQSQIEVRMDELSKPSYVKYLDFTNPDRVMKLILLEIRKAEDQAAFIMIQNAERELTEFTHKVIRGEFK